MPNDQATLLHPSGLNTRSVDAGNSISLFAGRRGLLTNSPLQFGHFPLRTESAHEEQKVHSKEHIRASDDSGGRSLSQHSQFGFNKSIFFSFVYLFLSPNPAFRNRWWCKFSLA